jgi:hypothetical protein
MRYLSGVFLSLLFPVMTVYADNASPPGFEADISKPSAGINVTVPQPDDKPVTPQSKSAWSSYDQPLRNCVPGDTILPSANNKILSFLFNNQADTNATMSIQGWKGAHCQVKFSEGTLVKSCLLTSSSLKALMDNLLDPAGFDINSPFAQRLSEACQSNEDSAVKT